MTQEESLRIWKLEMDNFNSNSNLASKSMKKMYSTVDKVINNGIITYEDFTNDMIDELTTLMVENGNKEDSNVDRATEVDTICSRLTEKYEAKYNERKSGTGAAELSTDSTEIQDTKELCESERASAESFNDSTEIA